MQQPTLWLATLAVVAALAGPGAPTASAATDRPFQLAAASEPVGIDLDKTGNLQKHRAERTGHAHVSQAEVKAAKAALSASQKAAYDKVVSTLAGHKPQLAQLEALLAKHRLKYADAHGHTVLDNLLVIATKPTLHDIDTATLLGDVVADITRPSTIDQAAHGTCTATSLQAALARQNPAEYARVLAGLATGNGQVTLKDGKLVLNSSNFIAFKDRTPSSNLIQPAIMAAESKAEGGRYDNKTDTSTDLKTGQTWHGESNADVSSVENAMLNGHYTTLEVRKDASRREQAWSIVKKATAKNPVLASIRMKDGGGHEIQVVGFEAGKQAVKIRNPWGEYVFIPASQFKAGVTGVNYRDR